MVYRSGWIPAFILMLTIGCGGTEPPGQPTGEYEGLRGPDISHAKQLYRQGKKAEGAALLRELVANANWTVRSHAIRTIGDVQDQDLLPEVHGALRDERLEIRESASRVLQSLGDLSSVEPLRKALSDPEPIVRSNSAEALARIAGGQELGELEALLMADEDLSVRATVAATLGGIRDPAVIAPLVGALSDQSAIVRGEAAAALGELGHASGRSALEKTAAADPDEGVRIRARAALQRLEKEGDGKNSP